MTDWPTKPLGDYLERLTYGFTNPMPTAEQGPYMVTAKDINRGRILYESARRTTLEAFTNRITDKCRPEIGDVLLTKDGTLGRMAVVDRENVCINQSVALLKPKETIRSRYIKYLLEEPTNFARMLGDSDGTTIKHIYVTRLAKMTVSVPPVPVQDGILEILATLDDKIELNRQMNAVLEGMARAVFVDWFVDFGPTRRKMAGEADPVKILGGAICPEAQAQKTAALFPDRLGQNGLPEGWEEVTVKEMASRIQNGGTPSRKRSDYWEMGSVPWLTSGEVRQSFVTKTKTFITPEGLANSSAKLVPAGSVLIALYGATAGQVSFATVPISTNQAVCAVIPYDNDRYYLLLAMRDKVSELARSATGSAQQNISKKIVEDVNILRAPDAIHSEFEMVVGPLFSKVIAAKQENQTLADMRDLLLPKLMSGEIRLREAE